MMMLTRDQARQIIRGQWRQFWKPDKGGKGIICPLCDNGSGRDGDGIRENPKRPGALKCFKCGFSGDAIDLYQQEHHADYNTALQMMIEYLGYEIERYQAPSAAQTPTGAPQPVKDRETPTDRTEAPQEPETADYSGYYRVCAGRLQESPAAISYLQARGISRETAAAYKIGYDPQWVSPTVKKQKEAEGSSWTPPATARIIMPVSKSHYVARAIDGTVEKKYQKMNETGGGSAKIFNGSVITREARPVFVVEGVFDALSIIEAGEQAIALNSTSNADALIKYAERYPVVCSFILCLDNDAAGKRATDTLFTGFTRLNIPCITYNISGEFNDPNDALTGDRPAFEKAIREACDEITRPDSVGRYIQTMMGDEIARYSAVVPTGFVELDRISGGIYPGLYTLGAISSLGKTTFAHQIADQIAMQGTDVLYFSMEQSRLEMVSKSIARITAQKDLKTFAGSLSIRRGYAPPNVQEAAREYIENTGGRMNVIEGNFNCNISFIGDYIRKYIALNNVRPVVFIDYLQILRPTDEEARRRSSAKEVIDAAVVELKRISRETGIAVFVISSVNRVNYLTPIDFESFKESGGIEYTCDVVWGLQLQCLGEPLFSQNGKIIDKRNRVKQAKAATPRKIELVCLKNRYGIANYSCGFDYYPAADLFVELDPLDGIEITGTGIDDRKGAQKRAGRRR